MGRQRHRAQWRRRRIDDDGEDNRLNHHFNTGEAQPQTLLTMMPLIAHKAPRNIEAPKSYTGSCLKRVPFKAVGRR